LNWLCYFIKLSASFWPLFFSYFYFCIFGKFTFTFAFLKLLNVLMAKLGFVIFDDLATLLTDPSQPVCHSELWAISQSCKTEELCQIGKKALKRKILIKTKQKLLWILLNKMTLLTIFTVFEKSIWSQMKKWFKDKMDPFTNEPYNFHDSKTADPREAEFNNGIREITVIVI